MESGAIQGYVLGCFLVPSAGAGWRLEAGYPAGLEITCDYLEYFRSSLLADLVPRTEVWNVRNYTLQDYGLLIRKYEEMLIRVRGRALPSHCHNTAVGSNIKPSPCSYNNRTDSDGQLFLPSQYLSVHTKMYLARNTYIWPFIAVLLGSTFAQPGQPSSENALHDGSPNTLRKSGRLKPISKLADRARTAKWRRPPPAPLCSIC